MDCSREPNSHKPIKVLETNQIIIYDDFLSAEEIERVYRDFLRSDFSYINTTGKVSRAWKIRDGFPLRGNNLFYYSPNNLKPEQDWVFPNGTDLGLFIEGVNRILPEVSCIVGREGIEWQKYSATQWIYQRGTGLSLHDDSSNTYSGGYAFFLSKEWNLHWGGLLLVLDRKTAVAVKEFRVGYGEYNYWAETWCNDKMETPLIFEPGFGQFILPKFNRIVFIKNDALHTVTSVSPSAGDRIRMSIAGFFHLSSEIHSY
jgi:Rps23 Pro-64 3,4-dihydroxylase Tpa1-like proline 4-hydroxylase